MGTSVGVGYSVQRNPEEAGREAARKALERAGITKPDFVFVFATVGYNQQVLIRAIREATSGAPLSGCSGEGIITRETVDESNFCVGVMTISSDELRFNNAYIREIGSRAGIAGEQLAGEIKPFVTSDSKGCFIMADGLVFNYDPLLAAFEAALRRDPPLPLFGGLAADNWVSRRTYQYHNDEVISEGISCVVMSGKGDIAWGVNHGCVPLGSRRTITRSKGNVIYEIDGVSSMEVMKEYMEADWLKQWNKTTLNLCLGFKTPEHLRSGYEEYIVRYLVGKNDEEGSVTIQSEVTDGTELWIVRRDKDLIAGGLQAISRQIREKMGQKKPKFVMQFECVGRGKVVFREKEKIEMIASLQNDIGADIPWLGFYTYGEIGPVAGFNCFHNFTAVIAVVY